MRIHHGGKGRVHRGGAETRRKAQVISAIPGMCVVVFVVIFSAKMIHAQPAAKVNLPGSLYSVDTEAPARAARIQVQLLPLLEPLENAAPGKCASLKRDPAGQIFKLTTDSAGGFTLWKVPPGQYFAVVTSQTESFDLISACITVTGPEESKSCGAAPAKNRSGESPSAPAGIDNKEAKKEDKKPGTQGMLVRYATRMKSYHGDILMSHPCAEHPATACDSLHATRPVMVSARQILLQHGGEPLSKAAVKVTRFSQKEGTALALVADAHGMLDAGALYSLAEGTGNSLMLAIAVGGETAKIRVEVAAEPRATKQTLSFFQRKQCGWETEMITQENPVKDTKTSATQK